MSSPTVSSLGEVYFFFFALLVMKQKPAMKSIIATPTGTAMAMITYDLIPPFPGLLGGVVLGGRTNEGGGGGAAPKLAL